MRNIETERLILTQWTLEDAPDLYEYAKNPNVGPHAGWSPHKDLEESVEIIKTIFLPCEAWALRDKSTGKAIGSIGLETDKYRPEVESKEIGYSLAEEYWGKGLMTEAAKAVIDFAFRELKLEVIGICTSEKNARSQSVINKCGFHYDGTMRKVYRIYDGTVRDSRVYSLLREEWEQRNPIFR